MLAGTFKVLNEGATMDMSGDKPFDVPSTKRSGLLADDAVLTP